MKKLVIFIGGLKFGGMERVAFIAAELLKDLYDITIVTLYQSNAEYDLQLKNYDIAVPPRTGAVGYFLVALKRLIRTKKMKKVLNPDIVLSFGMYVNYMNALTKGKEKIVMGIRSYDWLTKPFFSKKMDAYIVSKFDSVNAVSQLIAKDVFSNWRVANNMCRVIYNPYDIEYIQNKAEEPIDDFIFDDDLFYYVSMGRLSHQKAYNHLIKAFSIVNSNNKNTRLIIMGNGELKDQLQLLINNLGLSDYVFLLGGKENPYKYVQKSQVYVLSSLSEGFPNAMVESMALSVPIVATDCNSGPREILAPGTLIDEKCSIPTKESYGILVAQVNDNNNFNPEEIEDCDKSLAEGMIMMFDHETRKEYANRSLEGISSFNYEAFRRRMLEELESLN